jgi:hypothetical protein
VNPRIQFGWDCDGLLDCIRRESIPGQWRGPWMDSAPLMARLCAHKARVLGLLDLPDAPTGPLAAPVARREVA